MPRILRVTAKIEISADDITTAAKALEITGPFLDAIRKLGGDTDWGFVDEVPKRIYKKRLVVQGPVMPVLRKVPKDSDAA